MRRLVSLVMAGNKKKKKTVKEDLMNPAAYIKDEGKDFQNVW